MTRQVEAECADHLAKARAEADRILRDAQAKAAASRDAVLAAARTEIDRLDTLWKQKTEAESVRLELTMEKETVEAALAEVQSEIRKIAAGPNFGRILEQLAREVVNAVGDVKGLEALGPETQIEAVKKWFASAGHAGVSVKGTAEFWDGVALQDPQRSYRISNTLTGRFARVEQAARKHCMTALFGSRGR
jgi:vacuolar-type H+-ATPase subunit E/Vma4